MTPCKTQGLNKSTWNETHVITEFPKSLFLFREFKFSTRAAAPAPDFHGILEEFQEELS